MKVKLAFYDWLDSNGLRAIPKLYDKLSIGDFHSGTTFNGEIDLNPEQEVELLKTLKDKNNPIFWIGKEDK